MEPKPMEQIDDRPPEAEREAKPPEPEVSEAEREALRRPIEQRERESDEREHGELTEE